MDGVILPAGASRGGAAPGAGAHTPPGESEERSGGSDQRHERQAGRGRADGSERRQEDHPEAGGKGTESQRCQSVSPSGLSTHIDIYWPDYHEPWYEYS